MAIHEPTKVRLRDDETAFLLELEEFQEGRKGVGPAIHRLIEVARAWYETGLAKPLREYLKSENMTVEEFAKLAGLQPWTVRDILSLKTRTVFHETAAKVRAVIGRGE